MKLLLFFLALAACAAATELLRTTHSLSPPVAPGWTYTLDSPACASPFRRCGSSIQHNTRNPAGVFSHTSVLTNDGCRAQFAYTSATGATSNATIFSSVHCPE